MKGTVLVLENDGTVVDEDDSLIFYEKEIFILLSESEKCVWTPALQPVEASTPSECSTVETYIISENEAEKPISLDILKNDGKTVQTWLEQRRRIQTQIVHIIVDEMRHIKTKIPLSAFKIVAHKLSERYPMFKDIDSDNEIIGDGCFTLTIKLMERNNYLNRPFKRKSTTAGKIPGKMSKKIANITSGCSSNWDPIKPNDENLDQENLKYSSNAVNETDENFHQYLEDSYSDIRMTINNSESLKDILNQWPILQKSKNAFYWHFQNLTKVDLTMIGMKINSKANKIIDFGIQNKLHHSEDNIEPGYAVLQIFSKYFKEDIGKFIFEVKVCSNLND
ncbi:hypothetical protein ALC62_15737 [Cyphomyrmex costatus]|uniref:Uncharacterized protein n=1 Tax=Cyphomyrmex costatus TaxID=456900 RepID=A0A151I6H3_9HYME|nr:hypothetical protein ALC62_15737 [Cyphomyrmex costatus]